MAGRLAGKVAVVTGAGSGMGAAMAQLFCAEGAKVIAADISGKEEVTAKKIGAACRAVRVDVAQSQSVQGMMNAAIDSFGRLDILCNNAGIQRDSIDTADHPEHVFHEIMGVNCTGVFLGMKYAIPLMLKTGGGSIVNTSSMAAIVAFPGMVAYCASKAAVAMMTKCTAAEYAGRKIRVNAIQPGAIDTGMTQGMAPAIIEGAVKATPMGHIGVPMDIANLALYFASDESAFVTGTLVPVDGGYTLL